MCFADKFPGLRKITRFRSIKMMDHLKRTILLCELWEPSGGRINFVSYNLIFLLHHTLQMFKWMHLSAEPSLLHACMTHAQCIAWLTMYDRSSIELHTLHLNMVMVGWYYSLGDLGLEGRHLAMSLYKLKASANWIMHLRATACLHYHCIDNWPAKCRMAINHVAEVGAM